MEAPSSQQGAHYFRNPICTKLKCPIEIVPTVLPDSAAQRFGFYIIAAVPNVSLSHAKLPKSIQKLLFSKPDRACRHMIRPLLLPTRHFGYGKFREFSLSYLSVVAVDMHWLVETLMIKNRHRLDQCGPGLLVLPWMQSSVAFSA